MKYDVYLISDAEDDIFESAGGIKPQHNVNVGEPQITIDDKNFPAVFCKRRCKICCNESFTDTAFTADNTDDLFYTAHLMQLLGEVRFLFFSFCVPK